MNLLPHFYRNITAKKDLYSKIILMTEVFLFFALVSTSLYLYTFYHQLQKMKEQELKSLYSWENLINKFPNYPEVYYQAAIHAGRLKEFQKAEGYIQKALRLNSSFKDAKELKENLEKL